MTWLQTLIVNILSSIRSVYFISNERSNHESVVNDCIACVVLLYYSFTWRHGYSSKSYIETQKINAQLALSMCIYCLSAVTTTTTTIILKLIIFPVTIYIIYTIVHDRISVVSIDGRWLWFCITITFIGLLALSCCYYLCSLIYFAYAYAVFNIILLLFLSLSMKFVWWRSSS